MWEYGAEPHGLFSDLLPPPPPSAWRRRREAIVPDALLERPAATDEARGAGLHRTLYDCKGGCTSARVYDLTLDRQTL